MLAALPTNRYPMIQLNDERMRAANAAAVASRDGVSLVAFYGDAKPEALRKLLATVSAHFAARLREFVGLFDPYPLSQVHATIAGLEGKKAAPASGDIVVGDNAQARQHRFGGATSPIDFSGLLAFLRQYPWPVPFQFGGYSPTDRNPFDVRNSPWDRTFDVQQNGLVVIMAWSCLRNGTPFAPTLLSIRKSLEKYGVVHKYHIDPAEQDNDLFLVLGSLRWAVWRDLKDAGSDNRALAALREARDDVRLGPLARPLLVQMDSEQLSVVRYECTTLGRVKFRQSLDRIEPSAMAQQYDRI